MKLALGIVAVTSLLTGSALAEEVIAQSSGPITLSGKSTTVILTPTIEPAFIEDNAVTSSLCVLNEAGDELFCPDLNLVFELRWVQKD